MSTPNTENKAKEGDARAKDREIGQKPRLERFDGREGRGGEMAPSDERTGIGNARGDERGGRAEKRPAREDACMRRDERFHRDKFIRSTIRA